MQIFCEVQHCSPLCRLTPWTNWSPCSRTCGRGQMVRTRHSEMMMEGEICPNLEEVAPCQLQACSTACIFTWVPEILFGNEESLRACNGTLDSFTCPFECWDGYEPDHPLTCVSGIFKASRDFKDTVLSILRIRYLVPRMCFCAVFGCLAICRFGGCLNSTVPSNSIRGIPKVSKCKHK